MQITDIKIRKFFEDGPMKAIVSVTFDDCLAVHDIKVIYARDRYFIVMPSRKNPDGTFDSQTFMVEISNMCSYHEQISQLKTANGWGTPLTQGA